MADGPLEQQLEQLAECGLGFVSGAALAHAVSEWGPERLASDVDSLIAVIGSEFEDQAGGWQPAGYGAWHLDTECIYSAADYVKALERLVRLARREVDIRNISAEFADAAWIEFELDGERVHWDLEVSDDWIDTSLIDRFDELLRSSGSDRRLCAFESSGQDLVLVCPTQGEFDQLITLSNRELAPIAGTW